MPETPNTVTNATREQLCGSSQSYKSLLPLYRDVEVAVIILLSENTIICLFVTKHSHFLPQCKQTFIKNLQISFYFRHCKLCIFFFFFSNDLLYRHRVSSREKRYACTILTFFLHLYKNLQFRSVRVDRNYFGCPKFGSGVIMKEFSGILSKITFK